MYIFDKRLPDVYLVSVNFFRNRGDSQRVSHRVYTPPTLKCLSTDTNYIAYLRDVGVLFAE